MNDAEATLSGRTLQILAMSAMEKLQYSDS